MDLSNNPHLLVAGTTGSGKTTLLHNIIVNLIINNGSILHLFDPKRIEFGYYDKLNMSNISVYNNIDEYSAIFETLNDLMETRYRLLSNNLDMALKPIIIIIDEFGDLVLQNKQVCNYITKLVQKSRAAKIYMILATQRPSTKIIDGNIKANVPARIACKTASSIDSKIILDYNGAEKLIGNGDALLKDNTRNLERFQIAYVSPKQFEQFYIKKYEKFNS